MLRISSYTKRDDLLIDLKKSVFRILSSPLVLRDAGEKVSQRSLFFNVGVKMHNTIGFSLSPPPVSPRFASRVPPGAL